MRLRRRLAELEERVAVLEASEFHTFNPGNDGYDYELGAHRKVVEFEPYPVVQPDEEWRGMYL